MPFTSETAKLLRGPGGRKKGDPVKKAAAIIAREYIEQNIKPVLETYIGLAAGQIIERETKSGKQTFRLDVDPATTRHAVDKILPEPIEGHARGSVAVIQFIQFNHHSASLPSEAISAPVLAGDGEGRQAGGKSLAPAVREGQNGLKFHNFEDVS